MHLWPLQFLMTFLYNSGQKWRLLCMFVFLGGCLQSDVIRKPQGQIELNSSCRIVRGEGAQTFQVSGKSHLKCTAMYKGSTWCKNIQTYIYWQLSTALCKYLTWWLCYNKELVFLKPRELWGGTCSYILRYYYIAASQYSFTAAYQRSSLRWHQV